MTTRLMPICCLCQHFDKENDSNLPKCTAFPERIPELIWILAVDHRRPYPGDGGLLFEPDSEEAAEYATLVFSW
jgi:hypothetical protein